jgi:DNA-binding NarL/FixJ family response regulator
MNSPIKVIVVEHQMLTRLGLEAALNGAEDIELIGQAATSRGGLELFERMRPDVTILGLRFPDSCAIDDLDSYLVITSRPKIIVLADHAGDSKIARALKKGASGYICKDITADELQNAIRTVAAGRKYIPDEIAAVLSEHYGDEELTPAETNVLRSIVGGMSNKEIAFALDVSENTIKSHIQNIFSKIGVSDRTSAATAAIKRGLVRIDI